MRTDGVWMRRRAARAAAALASLTLGSGLVAVSGFAGTGGATGEPAPAAFRTADGSAGCALVDGGRLACRAAGALTGAELDADGGSGPGGEQVSWGDATPVLLPAESWWHGEFTCRVRTGGLTCAAGGGAITVSAGGSGGIR